MTEWPVVWRRSTAVCGVPSAVLGYPKTQVFCSGGKSILTRVPQLFHGMIAIIRVRPSQIYPTMPPPLLKSSEKTIEVLPISINYSSTMNLPLLIVRPFVKTAADVVTNYSLVNICAHLSLTTISEFGNSLGLLSNDCNKVGRGNCKLV